MNEQPQKCATCQHRPSELWGCSHVQCPNRKPVTAQPREQQQRPTPPDDE